MARDYAQGFYNSKTWQRTRTAYKKSVGNLCERCLARGLIVPAEIVHHKVPVSPSNITDPNITLSFDNLEALCRDCHADAHSKKISRRFFVDEFGRVSPRCDSRATG